MSEFDIVNKAKHYNVHPSGIQAIEIVEHFDFCNGNAIKYLWRADEKGSRRQDIEKALYYVKRARERCRRSRVVRDPCAVAPYSKMRSVLDADPSFFRRHTINAIYEACRAISKDVSVDLYDTAVSLIEGELNRLDSVANR